VTIDNEDWGQIKALYEKALEVPEGTRADFVRQGAEGRTTVRETVLGMLEQTFHANMVDVDESNAATSDSEGPTTPMAMTAGVDPSERRTLDKGARDRLVRRKLKPGTLIEHFQLIRELGRGGMGSVYLAEQFVPIRRHVALKVVREGYISETGLKRFEAERQSLALMDHPSIAHVLEAGTLPDGNPYFAMEYINGKTLVDYCDEKRMTIRERIKLFIRVVEGVQHAHQRGIIHRDLKPSNIMVRERDGIAEPKIIDFGIAKAVSPDILQSDEQLTLQNAMIGTPAYMSPEQAAGQPIDIRTDVYALCMVLYELLAGGLPFNPDSLSQGNPFQNLYVIHSGEINLPSSRMGDHYANADEIAEQRQTTAKELIKHLKSDLDWIVLKGLAPDREDRYAAASNLVEDLWHYLDNKPVGARPAQRLYTLRKFISRHRTVAIAVAVAFVAVLGGITAGAVGLYQALEANKVAVAEKDKAEAINTFLTDMLSAANPHGGDRDIKVVEVLSDATERLAGQFPDRPDVKVSLYISLVQSYKSLGKYDQAIELSQQAIAWGEPILGKDNEELLELHNLIGEATGSQGKYEEAKEIYEFILRATDSDTRRDDPVRYTALNNLGIMHAYTDDFEKGCDFIRQSYEGRVRIFNEQHPKTLNAMGNWAACLMFSGETERALPVLENMLAQKREVYGLAHPSTLSTMENLARAYERTGKLGAALRLFQANFQQVKDAFGIDHDRTTIAASGYGEMLSRIGYHQLATEQLFEVIEPWLKESATSSADQVYRFKTIQKYVEVLLDLDQAEAALELMERFESKLKEPNYEEIIFKRQRAFFALKSIVLATLGRTEEADALGQKIFRINLENTHNLGDQMDNYRALARVTMPNDMEAALELVRTGLELDSEQDDNYDYRTLKTMEAEILMKLGRYEESFAILEEMLIYWENNPKWQDFFLVLRTLRTQSRNIIAMGHENPRFFESHLQELDAIFGPESAPAAELEFLYSAYLMEQDQLQQAKPKLEYSLKLLKDTHGPRHRLSREAEQLRAVLYEKLGDQPEQVDLQQN
jgi:non-specific serine/threonine protein kinase/serine/threonine-protein kinase